MRNYTDAITGLSNLPALAHKHAHRQCGATLIELMVGITIGLLTVAVALSTLMVSRSVSGTVTEASQMQQQAAYAFRMIGQQVRQAGSIKLNLAFGKDAAAAVDAADPVAFEKNFNRKADTVSGKDTPGANEYQLLIGYQNYPESIFTEADPKSLFRDCLGNQPSTTIIKSGFILVKTAGAATGELKCAGSNNSKQPVISNVADFQVRYLTQDASSGQPTITYATATAINTAGNWPAVSGVEVCLELVGDETITTSGATYRDCSWKPGDTEKDRGNKIHMVFKNTFQIRSQNSI
jgi:type IV pilus assembly protein PilW